jgi:tRNA (guanine37-N1)-methyltransferase
MRFDILTLFPTMFDGPLGESIIKRAVDAGLLDIRRYNIRDYASDKHKSVDDYPYGGGAGMVMRVDVLARAVGDVVGDAALPVILMTPQGRLFNQQVAAELAQHQRIVLVCGHYEGIDERAMSLFSDQISIGDYVLTGGELAAMVIVDAVARLVPGVLAEASPEEESHSGGLLEYPQYTRPPEWPGQGIPPVLLSGHHAEIARWRRKQALVRTRARRPDLLAHADLSAADRKLLAEIEQEETATDEP